MENIITADEARKIVEDIRNTSVGQHIPLIAKEIESMAKDGRTWINYHLPTDWVNEQVDRLKKFFQQLGYGVEINSCNWMRISW